MEGRDVVVERRDPESDAAMESGCRPSRRALQVVKELPYARWRDYDSEDTLRFYALRMHEAGMIKSSPQKIIARGSDQRFINELKKELKG